MPNCFGCCCSKGQWRWQRWQNWQSSGHITTINMQSFSDFTDWMPFLLPSQQCQSIKGHCVVQIRWLNSSEEKMSNEGSIKSQCSPGQSSSSTFHIHILQWCLKEDCNFANFHADANVYNELNLCNFLNSAVKEKKQNFRIMFPPTEELEIKPYPENPRTVTAATWLLESDAELLETLQAETHQVLTWPYALSSRSGSVLLCWQVHRATRPLVLPVTTITSTTNSLQLCETGLVPLLLSIFIRSALQDLCYTRVQSVQNV